MIDAFNTITRIINTIEKHNFEAGDLTITDIEATWIIQLIRVLHGKSQVAYDSKDDLYATMPIMPIVVVWYLEYCLEDEKSMILMNSFHRDILQDTLQSFPRDILVWEEVSQYKLNPGEKVTQDSTFRAMTGEEIDLVRPKFSGLRSKAAEVIKSRMPASGGSCPFENLFGALIPEQVSVFIVRIICSANVNMHRLKSPISRQSKREWKKTFASSRNKSCTYAHPKTLSSEHFAH